MPSLITAEYPCPTRSTWTNVWPTVSVTGLPAESKNSVGAVFDFLLHVPLMVLPFVAIQALPVPTTFASRRCLFGWPSLSGPKIMFMITTFLGATRLPSALSICFFSPVTERR